jgi:hypothetical protein
MAFRHRIMVAYIPMRDKFKRRRGKDVDDDKRIGV